MLIRIGHGYDVHRLVPGRELILGGVKMEYEKGLLGHSDADVLVHALADALLGALGDGDIGKHFPDSDEAYKGISSLLLLRRVAERMASRGYCLGNADITLIAQRPKIAPYLARMGKNLAEALNCDAACINIKGTTEEGLGFTGSGEGMAAHAVCLLYRRGEKTIFL